MRLHDFHTCSPALLLPSALASAVFVLASGLAARAQNPQAPPIQATAPQSSAKATPHSKPDPAPPVKAIKEDDLKPQLVGKTFYLRKEYVDDRLHFDERGQLVGSSPRASYTLAMVRIDKINLSKHKLELQGIRYGLHFIGTEPTDDPLRPSEIVRITPKKKVLKITIDCAQVVKARKKSKSDHTAAVNAPSPGSPSAAVPLPPGPMDQAHANALLRQAIDNVFSPGMDQRMIASLPDFWQLYFNAAAAKSAFLPSDHSVLTQNVVDQKARLITGFTPPSNDFAQDAGVAGVAIYHVVVAPDGKPAEIAVGRPIGFGLDENAVASIRKASFQPAVKDGKPVPVLVDLVVEFRIFSKRTGAESGPGASAAQLAQPDAPPLPGPYSAEQPAAKQP
jgi:TonB family protein